MTPTSDLEKKMELGREIVSVLVPTGKQVKCRTQKKIYFTYNIIELQFMVVTL